MLPKGLDIVARTKLAIDEMTKWAREEFDLPKFKVDVRFKGSTDRTWARNVETPLIQLGVQSLMKHPVVGFMEYRSFNNYLRVGGFKTDDWRLWLDAVIAHEMSHCVHYALKKKFGLGRRDYSMVDGWGRFDGQPHGTTFLNIYQRIRDRFVNDRVPREAYTAPRQNFAFPSHGPTLEGQRIGSHPLTGVQIRINGRLFEVLGKGEESARKQYSYKAKCLRTGTVFGVKLVDIAATPAANDIIAKNPALVRELEIAKMKAVRRVRRSRYSW